MGGFGAGAIKSIQAFAITVANNVDSATATLSPAVVVENSYIIQNGSKPGSGANSNFYADFDYVLTNTTTVTVSRSDSPGTGDSGTVRGYVVEKY